MSRIYLFFIEKHHAFDSSIRSRARMCHLKNSLIERIDTLEHDNQVLRKQYYQTKEDFQNLKKGDLELRRYVLEVAALADRAGRKGKNDSNRYWRI